ncbi:Hypothetical predicted protein [Paramuricea clavata]|uniref:P2X purinoreceptor 7 intracellular domain-containing protein n=1 Tax=Paramuricea clavata TaxID=317549 RepID=A0A6S7FPM9_PARCT|nr:Hypothetical predicted protein [Paramuricea clavata]
MASEESDSDLNVEVYDPEDNVNVYGSPVAVENEYLKGTPDNVAVVSASPSGNHANRTQFCSCKNTCSRGSGRKKRGCPCRDEGLRYIEQCTCGTKKTSCKNRICVATTSEANNAGRNTFEHHQLALEEARQQITKFLGTLNEGQKDSILLELLTNGKGSLDYAKNIVQFGMPPPDFPSSKPSWCTCGVCRPMASEEENKCCGKIRCVTSFITFENFALIEMSLSWKSGEDVT